MRSSSGVPAPAPVPPSQAVCFLHGMFGGPGHWAPQAQALRARGVRVTAPDLPILDADSPARTMEDFARLTLETLDAEGIDRATLVGNSFGGHVALLVALKRPERVAGLVLAGSSGLFERTFSEPPPRRPSREWLRARIEEVFFDPARIPAETLASVEALLAAAPLRRRVVAMAKAAKRSHLGDKLSLIAAPTLLVWGRDDSVTPLHVAHEFRAALAKSRLLVLARCGHAPMLEHPEAFTGALLEFLESGVPAQAAPGGGAA